MRLRFPVLASALLFAASLLPAQQSVNLTIDASASTTPFPHFWEQTFGSGRAILALRDSYRRDLRTVKEATNFQSVRFHGILMDEVGLYDPDRKTKNPGLAAVAANDASVYNFSYIDQIYDGLLDNGVRPYVELSFMPRKLAADPNALHAFWYHPVVSPPADYAKWDAMISAFAQHLISRYGIEEVATWKFEVWNEPNLDFWGGDPRQSTYFELYDHTLARAIKAASSPRLQVGGPATAQAAWVTPFLAHVREAGAPIDFVSTHVYANDLSKDVFGTDVKPSPATTDGLSRRQGKSTTRSPPAPSPISRSSSPRYNASYANEPNITDSVYIGPWLANNIRLCDGLAENMAWWSFSDVFEEQGVVRTPFYGGYGLLAADNIPKPALNVPLRAPHKLGDCRIAVDSDSALATTTASYSLAVAPWNYALPDGTGATYTKPGPAGPSKTFHLEIKNAPNSEVTIWRIDENHGNVLKAFDAMGRPSADLTRDQVKQLQAAGAMAPPEHAHLVNGKLDLTIPAHGLAVLTFGHDK